MRSICPLFVAAFALPAPAFASEVISEPEFRSVELQGGGMVFVTPGPAQRVTILEGNRQFTRVRVGRGGNLRIDTCADRCPPNYRLRVEIQAPRVPDLAVDGGGMITTQNGFRPQPELSAALNGGGRIDARSIEANTVSAAVNGGGELLVRPRVELSAAINGGGHIRYWGNPTVSSAIRGGGQVSPGY